MRPTLSFQGGTLVLKEIDQRTPVHPAFRWIKARWRCEGYRYGLLGDWLAERQIQDQVPRWQRLGLTLLDDRQPHDYQQEALAAWDDAGRRGSIVLPTGAGKTFLACHAIQRVDRSTLVVAPTIDLLHQWYARLVNAFGGEVGVYYGAEKRVLPLTVTTYHSAGDLVAEWGNGFKLVIYDEVHHLPAPSWGETALMTPAPFRLGLTATYPTPQEQTGPRWRMDELIGPIVYEKRLEELVGQQLAEYRTERLRVDLTPEEQRQYEAQHGFYTGFLRTHRLYRRGPDWWRELLRMSAEDPAARQAVLARQTVQSLLAGAEGKIAALDRLLREHLCEPILIFTESNEIVYRISSTYLIPALTHETKAAERKAILEGFQQGRYRAIVTSKVRNEGVDVPEAKVAIVLGGSAGAREYIQRLGRVLRKVGNRQAVLYEIIVRNTVDVGRAQRRRPRRTTDSPPRREDTKEHKASSL
jgi:superfamily II DNA or RNA helicase